MVQLWVEEADLHVSKLIDSSGFISRVSDSWHTGIKRFALEAHWLLTILGKILSPLYYSANTHKSGSCGNSLPDLTPSQS